MNSGAILKTATAATIVAAVSLCVAAGGYALFVTAGRWWGPAGAAALTAGAAALLALGVGLIAWLINRETVATNPPSPRLSDYLIDMAFDRPLTSAALAVAAGWICLRNPRLVSLAFDLVTGGVRGRDR